MFTRLALVIGKARCLYICFLRDPFLLRRIKTPHLVDRSAYAVPRQRDRLRSILHRSQAGHFRRLRCGGGTWGTGWPRRGWLIRIVRCCSWIGIARLFLRFFPHGNAAEAVQSAVGLGFERRFPERARTEFVFRAVLSYRCDGYDTLIL